MTKDEKEQREKGTWKFFKKIKWIPEDVTFEEWKKAGMPMEWIKKE